MKLRIDYRSIKFKTWLYFILFAAVLMLALWIVQIFLLNNFYGLMKTVQTQEVAKEIESSYRHNDISEFVSDVDTISDSYDMYIYVVSYDGQQTFFGPSADDFALAPGLSDDSSRAEFASQIKTLNESMIKNNGSANMTFESEDSTEKVMACGRVLTSKTKDDMIAYIFSPLWPVSSTIKILTNQLFIVTLISLLLACVISLYLSMRITRPIKNMERTAARLASDEYGIVFPDGHYTELNNLSTTLTGASIELEKSDVMQKDLVANVSHDLRTPLTVIKSYAEMIRDLSGDNPEKRNEHLQVIIDETDRLNNLVEDLLAVSRLQSGKMTLKRTNFDLTEATRSIVNMYSGMENRYDSNRDGVIDEEDRQFHVTLSCKNNYTVNGDEEKIKQVIANLVSNAIKFCGDDGAVIVTIKRHGKYVRLSVQDHGAGIHPDEIEHIWDRYYRASSNTVRTTEGTGLGLSICKEILTLHKADFGVDSTPGKGSTFWFQLEIRR